MQNAPQAPQPPHNATVFHANGLAYLVTQDYSEVRKAIQLAFDSKDPFIDLTDNYGRELAVPVQHIIAVLAG